MVESVLPKLILSPYNKYTDPEYIAEKKIEEKNILKITL